MVASFSTLLGNVQNVDKSYMISIKYFWWTIFIIFCYNHFINIILIYVIATSLQRHDAVHDQMPSFAWKLTILKVKEHFVLRYVSILSKKLRN